MEWVNRVKEEKEQLDVKICKLTNFIFDGKPQPQNIKDTDYSLLKQQLKVMQKYSNFLGIRIYNYT